MNEDLKELAEWLQGTNLESIPTIPPQKRTLMDIMGIRELENPWSDIYKFFLDKDEDHCLGDLFIRCLEDVCKIENEFLSDFNVEREFVLDDKKRIDLLLTDISKRTAIIIENKVNHTLDNALDLYKEKVESKGYKDVKVIVLSLRKIEDLENHKCKPINITHKEYVDCINEYRNKPEFEAKGDAFYIRIMDQFIENVNNVTMKMKIEQEQIDFFYLNYEKAEKVHTMYHQVVENYKDALKNLVFEKYQSKPNKNGWVYLTFKGNEKIKLTIFFLDRIWKNYENGNPYFTIILELQGDVKEKINQLKKDKKLEVYKEKYQNLYFGEKLKWDDCGHFASWDIEINDKNDLKPNEFAEFVKKKIEEDSCGICKLAEEIREFCSKSQSSTNTVSPDN